MTKKEYISPYLDISEYTPMQVIAMSWSDEETGEVLAPERGETSNDWEAFWESRE